MAFVTILFACNLVNQIHIYLNVKYLAADGFRNNSVRVQFSMGILSTDGGQVWRPFHTVCMYVCMYVCVYASSDFVFDTACMYVCMHVCISFSILYVCLHGCMHVCLHGCMERWVDIDGQTLHVLWQTHTHTHTQARACMHTYMNACIRSETHVLWQHKRTHAHTHTQTYTHTHTHTHGAYMHTYIHVCMHTCVYVHEDVMPLCEYSPHVYIHIYIYIHTYNTYIHTAEALVFPPCIHT